jgi:hypothetical protein
MEEVHPINLETINLDTFNLETINLETIDLQVATHHGETSLFYPGITTHIAMED